MATMSEKSASLQHGLQAFVADAYAAATEDFCKVGMLNTVLAKCCCSEYEGSNTTVEVLSLDDSCFTADWPIASFTIPAKKRNINQSVGLGDAVQYSCTQVTDDKTEECFQRHTKCRALRRAAPW